MSLPEASLPNAQTVLYLGNVALAVVWLCAAALLVVFVCRRGSAPIRHGLLLLGLVLVLTSPALVWLAGRAGFGRLRVAMSVQREPIDKPDSPPDTQLPIADARQEQSAMEREAVPRPSAFAGEYQDFVREFPATVPDEPIEVAQRPRTEPVPLVDQVVTPEETASVTTTPWWLPIAQGFVLVWALGTTISLLWLARCFARLAAFCRGLREHPDDGMRQAVTQAAAQLGLARAPRLLVSARAVMPVTLGLFRPAIVLPEGFADDLPPDQCRAVLLHEMAHTARRDSWIGLAQRLAVVLYWWCPLVYWLNRRLADLREEVCDNFVLGSQGDGAPLAEVLVTLAERVVKPSPLPATLSVFEHHPARERSHALEHRIRRLLSTETNPTTRMNRAGVVLVVLAGLGMAGVIALSHVRAAEADEAVPESDVTASENTTVADPPVSPAAPSKSGEVESERARQIAEITAVAGWVIRDEDKPGKPVIEVTLNGDTITDAFLERLKVLEDLETLGLGPSRVTEAGLTHLKGLRRLRELCVTRTPVSDAFLNRLQELTQLEELNLYSNQLRDASLKQLRGLPQLKELSLYRNPITDDGLVHLAALPQLERLSLNDTFITDAGVQHLSRLPRLQEISLHGTRITGVGLAQLEKLTELRALSLGSTSVTDDGVEHLGKLTQLSVLDLSGTEVSDTGLEHLAGMTQLTSLGLDGTNITDAGLVHLRGLTQLETLGFGSQVTDAGLEHLSGLTGLVNLGLSGAKVTDAGLAHISGLTRIQRLDLSYTEVTSAGLKHLSGMTQLEKLDLTRTKVTEDGLRHLSGLTKLEDLELPDIPLSDTGLSYLQGLSQLHELDLSGGNLTDSGLRHLRGMSQLYRLDLSDTKVTDGTLKHLGELKQLASLNLTNTKITDAGLTHLAESTQLGGLILSGTQVTDDGLRHLGGLTQLQHLGLDETEVTDDGLKHLGGLTRLQHLALQKTEVTGTGLAHLSRLTGHPHLYLDGSKADVASVWEFKRSQPKVSIHPGTLTWGWGNPARPAGVHFTRTSRKILSAIEDDTRLDFNETPLDQVMEFMGIIHDIPIQLDEPTLRAAGAGTDVPVTHDVKGITLHSALRLMLGQLGLTYAIRDDALVITTVKEGQRLAQLGIINAEEVGREFENGWTFRRFRDKCQIELLRNTRFQFTETPLPDVVAFLKEQHDILFVVDQRALAAAGIQPDVRCTLDVKDMPLGSALRKVLRDVGLTYVVEDEFILITKAEKDAPKEAPAKPAAPAKAANPFGLSKPRASSPFAPPRTDDLASEQGKVIADIYRMQGLVSRDKKSAGQPVTGVWLRGNEITDAFLERLKVFDNLQTLSLMGTGFTTDGLIHLKGLRDLRTLAVAGPSVSNAFLDRLREFPQFCDLRLMVMDPLGDASLEHVGRLAQLRSLELGGIKLTDAGLAHLRGMTQLQKLRLHQTSVTEAGLQHLSGLTKLEKLDLGDIPLSDAGLAHLQGLSRLERLDLRGANVTDSGLRHLRGLSQLQRLYLADTQITDDGLVHLGGLTQLAVLDLTSTQITDDGLKHLGGLTRLQVLWLEKAKVTDTAARQFKRALPRVQIEPAILVWGWDTPTGDTDPRLTPTNKRILSALRDDTRLEFIETPLKDIAAFLQHLHDIPIQLDEPRMRAAGIGTNVPVTRNIKGIALYSALRMILTDIGLTYVIGEDALIITTLEEGTRLARQGKIGAAEVSREVQKNSRIYWLLQDKVSLQFTATPLKDVVVSLERQYSIAIGFDEPALAAAGIQADVPCTLDVKDVPLASALQKLLGDVGLTYILDDAFIQITAPKKDAPEKAPADSAAPTTAGEGNSEQAKVLAEIESRGGWVTRDESLPGRPVFEIVLLHQAEFTDAELERMRVLDNLRVLFLGQSHNAESKLTRTPDLGQLQGLWLMQMRPGNAFLESLQQLPKLETLCLARSKISDANLRSIGKLGRLKNLRLDRTAVPSASLAHLSGMSQLESLALGDTRVRDADLKHLRQLSQLTKLSFDGTFTTGAGLEHLAELAQLSELNVGLKNIGDADITHVNRLTRLTTLDLSSSGITDTGLGQLAILPQLTRLSLPDQITDAGLRHLRRATRLEVLHPGNNITDAGLANLSGLTRLEELTLGKHITDAGLENLSGLTRLKTLRISRCKITEDGLKHLRGLTQLVRLDLHYKMPLSDTGLAHLGRLTQLERLNLRRSSVTDEGLRHLRAMSQLVSLDLEDTDITDAGLVHVRGLTKLEDLNLANTKLAGAGLAHLPRNASLENLNLSGTSITDAGLAHLQGVELRALDLANTRVTDAGMEHLGRLKSLLGLNLTGTGVTDAGLAHLHGRKLEYLDLRGTQTTDAGLARLRGLTTLNHLDLRGTQISDEGLRHLSGLKAIQNLYLGKNVMGSGLVHLRGLSRSCWVHFGRSDADLAAVWRFKKERPDIRIDPSTFAWGWDNPARVGYPHFTQGTWKILEQLNEDTRLEFIETPLTDVLAFLHDQHVIPIQLDEPRLRAAGIATDVLVTQNLKGITLHNALRLTLSEWRLTYVIRDDALVITTKEEAKRLMQQGVINEEEVEREFAKERQTIRAKRAAKTVNALMEDTRCHFTATPLAEAVALLNEQHGILIEIDHAALAAAGIPPNLRCTANMENVPLATALRKLLDDVGLTYGVHGELISITTQN